MNRLLNALLFRFSGRLRCRIIKVHGEPYLERYFLGGVCGVHIYLHRFLASDDPEEGVHDHPWEGSLSIIPCGSYIEHRRWTKYPVRWWNYIDGDKFHQVELVPGVATWSIFMAWSPKPGRVWGMLKNHIYPNERGDMISIFEPYKYGDGDNNPSPGKWWETHPVGHKSERVQQDYVYNSAQ